MYRFQVHIQVKLGHFAAFHALVEELNSALRANGLVPFQLWAAAVGRFNEFVMVVDYGSLGAYEREQTAMHADAVCMGPWRDMDAHFDGTPWTDLWSRPPAGS